ncbi:hypothetical protein KM043_009591 [Ampulex compressa]|nr:hypothetical protein KM043_009591 [Ampulex compressa]
MALKKPTSGSFGVYDSRKQELRQSNHSGGILKAWSSRRVSGIIIVRGEPIGFKPKMDDGHSPEGLQTRPKQGAEEAFKEGGGIRGRSYSNEKMDTKAKKRPLHPSRANLHSC